MANLSFYFDENVPTSLADALKTRGIDVLTKQQGGNIGAEDIDQIIYATQKTRTLFSYNKRDFAVIHYQWMQIRRPHSGIILSDQLPIGVVLRRLMKLYYSVTPDDMKNRLVYLGAWK